MALGVAAGAFGAHALRDKIPPSDLLIWEKAVLYHLVHGLAAILALAFVAHVASAERIAVLFLCGILVFSGSLYTLVLTNTRWLGAITPIGGTAFIVAWFMLALSFWRAPS